MMNDTEMNEKLKYCMVGIYKKLVDEVDPRYIMDLLIEKRVISIEERERIIACSTRQERCRMLLDKFFTTSNPSAFIVLRQALQEDYSWISNELDENCSQIQIGQENSHRRSGRQCTSVSNEHEKRKSANANVLELVNRIKELEGQLKSKDDEITELKKHVVILEDQIKKATSSILRSDETQDEDNLFDEADGPYEESILDESTSGLIIIEKKRFTNLKKLPRYCHSTYDLWVGQFEDIQKPACIKEFHDGDKSIDHFTELNLLKGLKHPRITNLLGRSPDCSPRPFIVLESSTFPNVLTSLKKMTSRKTPLPKSIIMEWIVQMASGVEYLHENKILHRNITTSNIILCNSGHSIKITNFQNATTIKARNYVLEADPLPLAEYTAPEVLSKKKWSMATDVWSFGLTALKMWIGGRKIFPEMTRKDIVEFFLSATEESIANLLNKYMEEHEQINETIRRCLNINESHRPEMAELSSFDKYVNPEKNDILRKKRKFEHMVVCGNPVRGMTSLSDVLYVILMYSNSIKCFDIKNGLLKLKSIRLEPNTRSRLRNYFNHREPKGQVRQTRKSIRSNGGSLKSIDSDTRLECLYVFDDRQSLVFKVTVQSKRTVCKWEVPEECTSLSVTPGGTVLLGSCSSDYFALEYNAEGDVISKISSTLISDGPWKTIRVDIMHCLILHGDIYSASHQEICMLDNDGLRSSGYGKLLFHKISDVAIHRPSGKIFLAEASGNRIVSSDRYLKSHPRELLNIHDGITAPSSIYILENSIFVGLMNGNIYCFEFS